VEIHYVSNPGGGVVETRWFGIGGDGYGSEDCGW